MYLVIWQKIYLQPVCLNIYCNHGDESYIFTDIKLINEFVDSIKDLKYMEVSENEYNKIQDDNADYTDIVIVYPKSSIDIRLTKVNELPVSIHVDQRLFDMSFSFADENFDYYYGKNNSSIRNINKEVEEFLKKNTSEITIDEIKEIISKKTVEFEDFGVYRNICYSKATEYYNEYCYEVKDTDFVLKVMCSPEWWPVSEIELKFNEETQILKGDELRYVISEVWLCDKNENKINLLEDKDIDDFINKSK